MEYDGKNSCSVFLFSQPYLKQKDTIWKNIPVDYRLKNSTNLLQGCETKAKGNNNHLCNNGNVDTFITEWSVPIQIVYDQNLNYDFVVDWS